MPEGDTVRAIARNCFTDAVEALSIIEVLEAANGNGVSKSLNEAKAGRAAAHIQRALFSRMHIIVSRHFLPARKDDLTAMRAFELLADATTRTEATKDTPSMATAEAEWKACNADPNALEIIEEVIQKHGLGGQPADPNCGSAEAYDR